MPDGEPRAWTPPRPKGVIVNERNEPPWRRQAACKGLDPTIFYPADEDDECLEAKAVCAQCPVNDPCLEHALGVREKVGIWGGCTERERRRIIRQRRRTA